MSSKRKKVEVAPFDVAEYLDNEELIAEYLNVALNDPDPDMFSIAVANVAKAYGMRKVADETGLGRESLYKALAPGSKIRLETMRKVLDSLGVRMAVTVKAA